eukprot:scaffold324611_cov61-Tisochrysis_lutea.AAC.2
MSSAFARSSCKILRASLNPLARTPSWNRSAERSQGASGAPAVEGHPFHKRPAGRADRIPHAATLVVARPLRDCAPLLLIPVGQAAASPRCEPTFHHPLSGRHREPAVHELMERAALERRLPRRHGRLEACQPQERGVDVD